MPKRARPKGKAKRFTGAGQPQRVSTKAKVGDTIKIERKNQWDIPPGSVGDVIAVIKVRYGKYKQNTAYWYRIIFRRGFEATIRPSHNWKVISKYFVSS